MISALLELEPDGPLGVHVGLLMTQGSRWVNSLAAQVVGQLARLVRAPGTQKRVCPLVG